MCRLTTRLCPCGCPLPSPPPIHQNSKQPHLQRLADAGRVHPAALAVQHGRLRHRAQHLVAGLGHQVGASSQRRQTAAAAGWLACGACESRCLRRLASGLGRMAGLEICDAGKPNRSTPRVSPRTTSGACCCDDCNLHLNKDGGVKVLYYLAGDVRSHNLCSPAAGWPAATCCRECRSACCSCSASCCSIR